MEAAPGCAAPVHLVRHIPRTTVVTPSASPRVGAFHRASPGAVACAAHAAVSAERR